MTAKTISNGILRSIFLLCGCIGLLWLLFEIKAIIVYILISSILALIARPLIKFLTLKLKIKNSVSATMAMGLYILIFSLFLTAFTPLINKQSKNIAMLNSEKFKQTIEQVIFQTNEYLLQKNINLQEVFENFDFLKNLKDLPNILNIIIGSLSSFGMGVFSILFITYFFMLDAKILKRSLYSFIPKKHILATVRSIDSIKDLLTRYFIGLFVQISVLFIIYSILLLSFSIENAVIISLLCALFNLIPYLGPLMGAIIMFILTATHNLELDFTTQILPNTLYIMLGYMGAQLIDNFISQPIIFSKSVKSHPLEIFLIILIFGSLFGIIGMVICIPCYTALKVIAKEFFHKYKPVQMLTQDL